MTSKKLYLAKWLENCKRRSWTFLLCLVMTFLFLPVTAAINLTRNYSSIQEEIARGMSAADLMIWEQNQKNLFLRMCGFSEEVLVLSCVFAVLFAVQGFSWLYSRKKTDLYMSVPVSNGKRYLMIMGNGIIVFGTAYLMAEICCILVGAGFGVVTFGSILQLSLAWVVNMLMFTAIYQVALLAVVLTGNVLTALLGCTVFFSYEPLMRLLVNQLKSNYFMTFCSAESERMMQRPYLTPLANAAEFISNTGYSNGKLYGSPYGENLSVYAGVGIQILIMAAMAGVWGLCAYILYRRRKTESYGYAIAFKGAKGWIRFALTVPFSIALGMLVSIWAGDSMLFLWAGALAGLVFGHAIIQLIYERDLRAIFKKVFSLALSGVLSAAVLAVFCYDLTGYDHYVPETDRIKAVAVTIQHDYSGVSRYYREPFDGSRMDLSNFLLQEMNSGDPDTIQAVADMAQDYVEHLKNQGEDYGRYYEEGTDFHTWVVRYKLYNGREVYRKFYSDAMQMTEQINTVMRDEAYQKMRCQLLGESFADALNQMKIIYNNGISEYLYTMDKEVLYQAFAEEMRDYDYTLISTQLPKGVLSFSIPNPEKSGSNLCYWEYPVYESFEKTIDLIAQNGIPVWEKHALSAEDIESISVDYYYYEKEEDNALQLVDEKVTAVAEQSIIVTVSEPDEIADMLEALYPQDLVEVTDSTIHRYDDFLEAADIQIHLSASGKQKRLDLPHMNLLKEKVPDFLIERLKNAAKTE